jgi:hypothetical protein
MKAVKERSASVDQTHARQGERSVLTRLFEPVDISSIVFFRVAFSALLLIDVMTYFAKDWINGHYIGPDFHFSYQGFEWVKVLPGDWLIFLFVVLGATAGMMMIGLSYRVAAALFFLGFTYVFLLDSTRYLNHFYLVILFAFLMIFVPAHRSFSVDARRKPDIRSRTVPAWSLWILRFQMGAVYFFGGVAKLSSDWIAGNPLRQWLADRTDFPIIGGLFDQEWVVFLFTWGSLALDLFALPLLLWKKTRPWAFTALVVFHLMNTQLFNIGIFPYLAIFATTLFLEPDWPRRVFGGSRRRYPRRSPPKKRAKASQAAAEPKASLATAQRVTAGLLAFYVAVQVLVPLRHFAYAGDVNWTEEGHRYSWHMMLRQKYARPRFFVTLPETQRTLEVDPLDHLIQWQFYWMSTRPHLILQYAHLLRDEYASEGEGVPEVRAHVVATLNGRPPQLLVDPRVDLAQEKYGWGGVDWIVPLGDYLWVPPPGSTASSVNEYMDEVVQQDDRETSAGTESG